MGPGEPPTTICLWRCQFSVGQDARLDGRPEARRYVEGRRPGKTPREG
jgi:hypothetical protein